MLHSISSQSITERKNKNGKGKKKLRASEEEKGQNQKPARLSNTDHEGQTLLPTPALQSCTSTQPGAPAHSLWFCHHHTGLRGHCGDAEPTKPNTGQVSLLSGLVQLSFATLQVSLTASHLPSTKGGEGTEWSTCIPHRSAWVRVPAPLSTPDSFYSLHPGRQQLGWLGP